MHGLAPFSEARASNVNIGSSLPLPPLPSALAADGGMTPRSKPPSDEQHDFGLASAKLDGDKPARKFFPNE